MKHPRQSRRFALRWTLVGVACTAAVAWSLLTVEHVETAPAVPAPFVEQALDGRAGGFGADVPDHARSVLVATRRPTGELDVECADPETAAAMLAGVRP